MKLELKALYKKLLFSNENLKTYAIAESAKYGVKIYDKMFLSPLKNCNLRVEKYREDTEFIPLYLIELQKENEIVDYLLENHHEAFITFFQSPYEMEELQAYYSPLTMPSVEIEEGVFREGVFGFHDPRVLFNYIETLYSQEKIDEFFAGIALWLTPEIEDASMAHLAYRTKRGYLENVKLNLEPFLAEEEATLDYDNVSIPNIPNLEDYVSKRVIDHKQVKMFNYMEVEKLINIIFDTFEQDSEPFMDNEINLKHLALTQFYHEAKRLEIETEAGIYFYILLSCLTTKNEISEEIKSEILEQNQEFKKINYLKEKIEKERANGEKR